MKIYFKCSFKNSKLGYRVSAYDLKTGKQTAIDDDPEKELYKKSACRKIYNYEIGKTMFLAANENGDLFLAVLGLVEGKFDKYVNAIFCDTDADLIYKMFLAFSMDYHQACKILLDCVQRNDEGNIGYNIDETVIQKLVHIAKGQEFGFSITGQPENTLLAFVSEDDVTDYELEIQRLFGNQDFEGYKLDSSGRVSKVFIENVEAELKGGCKRKVLNKKIILTILIILVLIIFVMFFLF